MNKITWIDFSPRPKAKASEDGLWRIYRHILHDLGKCYKLYRIQSDKSMREVCIKDSFIEAANVAEDMAD